MFTNDEFMNWCDSRNLAENTRNYIQSIRSSEPSRSVSGGRRSVSGKFPSRKMGLSIQFESHKVELPFVYKLEHDKEVLEYYDQPPAIKLTYQSSEGRNLAHFYTPDFFVIEKNSAGWIECKHEEELQRLAAVFSRVRHLIHRKFGQVFTVNFGRYRTINSDRE